MLTHWSCIFLALTHRYMVPGPHFENAWRKPCNTNRDHSVCIICPNLVLLAWTSDELSRGETEKGKFYFQIKFYLKVHGQLHQTNRDLNQGGFFLHLWSKFGHPSLNRWGAVLEIPTSPSVRGRQLWRRTGNILLTFLQFYVYDLRFKPWGPTTFLSFKHWWGVIAQIRLWLIHAHTDKVMAQVEIDGHIWGLVFNRHINFSFCGNRTIFSWEILNKYLTLKIQVQGHGHGQTFQGLEHHFWMSKIRNSLNYKWFKHHHIPQTSAC